ncbi:MAG: hypothetical protein M3257_08505 [Actinomycetota bacterium]|nr:hypothetical protein [Actinomycetota bacterium]
MTADGHALDLSFDELVRTWGAGVVDSYLETRSRNDSARSVKSLIEETAGEYGGRFFIELLQNAHDAHPAESTGGRVLMLLDETEGPHGTVYAADGGSGFTYGNFRAISNLALSNSNRNAAVLRSTAHRWMSAAASPPCGRSCGHRWTATRSS